MAAANPCTEKVQNLPSLCVETICKFTPTSKLIRLYSNAAPLPGAFWSLGVETALKKRLPLSLRNDLPCYPAYDSPAICDATGAKVACVKHPEAFRCSPLLEFIESAFLAVRADAEKYPSRSMQFYVRDGEAVLSSLQNVSALSLVLCDGYGQFEQKDLLASNLKHLLPQLEAFIFERSDDIRPDGRADQALFKFLRAMPMREMSRLRRLHLPFEAFRDTMEQSNSGNCSAQPGLPGLTSLGIWEHDRVSDAVRADVLRFVSTRCRELTVLFVFVIGEFKPYLDAFRALNSLKTLGMNLKMIEMNGLTYDGSEVINAVTDLRIISCSYDSGASIFKIAIFFPNIRVIALKPAFVSGDHLLLELATSLFGERQLFPAIAKLGCFFTCETIDRLRQPLTQFLANPRLPETVDLSHIGVENLTDDADPLTAIFCTMQASSIKSLLLRGPIGPDPETLPRLLSHIALKSENAEVSAWKDRDLGYQPLIWFARPAFSPPTDLQIIGLKTSGNLKGERFTIRVFHQLAKVVDIFN